MTATPIVNNGELYVPRKCSATGRILSSTDRSSIQINFANVSAEGLALPSSTTFTLSGFVRAHGESDDSINRLATKEGLLKNVWSPVH